MFWRRCDINTLRPGQDGRHFADDIFTRIFINENCCIFIKFSLKYVRKDPNDNNPALVQIMAWRRSGDKLLSEPMMVSLPTHICVTRPQWVKKAKLTTVDWFPMIISLSCYSHFNNQQLLINVLFVKAINNRPCLSYAVIDLSTFSSLYDDPTTWQSLCTSDPILTQQLHLSTI